MTAYLQHGDQIHLAYPSTGSKQEDDKLEAQVRGGYARLGVEVVAFTAANSISTPVVVAVFRAPFGQQSARLYEPGSCPDGLDCVHFPFRHAHPVHASIPGGVL